MEIEGESLDRITEWLLYDGNAIDGDRHLIMEFVASLRRDEWRERWRRFRDVASVYGSEQHLVELRDGLWIVLVLDYDGEPGLVQVPVIITG